MIEDARQATTTYVGNVDERQWMIITEYGSGEFKRIHEVSPGVWIGIFLDPSIKAAYFAVETPYVSR